MRKETTVLPLHINFAKSYFRYINKTPPWLLFTLLALLETSSAPPTISFDRWSISPSFSVMTLRDSQIVRWFVSMKSSRCSVVSFLVNNATSPKSRNRNPF